MYLTADDVIAATRDTMEATLDYLEQKYGDIDHYCREVRRPAPLPSVNASSLCVDAIRAGSCDVPRQIMHTVCCGWENGVKLPHDRRGPGGLAASLIFRMSCFIPIDACPESANLPRPCSRYFVTATRYFVT